jgi:iron only hydrogenase large subunit-like protein
MSIIDFKSTKCKHCYKCVRNCLVKAIQIKDERAEIMEDHCILCGQCLKVCPQKAKSLSSELPEVREMIRSGRRVVVTMAPSFMGLMNGGTTGQIRSALKQLGFEDLRETSEGAAFVTAEYEKLLQEGKMENIITTCCPGANDLIEKYYPQLVPYMAPCGFPDGGVRPSHQERTRR